MQHTEHAFMRARHCFHIIQTNKLRAVVRLVVSLLFTVDQVVGSPAAESSV